MGAMLIGMVTGGIAWVCFIVINLVLASIIFIDAYRHKMKAVIWAVMVLLFSFYAIPVYIIVRIKIARLKCSSCGTKIEKNADFCINCGQAVKKIDDKKIALKVLFWGWLIWTIILILGVAWTAIVG